MILLPGSVKGRGGGEVFVSKLGSIPFSTRLMEANSCARPVPSPNSPHKPPDLRAAATASNYLWARQAPPPLLIMDGSVNGRNRDGNISSPVSARQLLYKTSRAPEEKSSVLPSLLYLPHPHSHSQPHTPHHNLCISASSACTTFFLVSLFFRCHPPSTEGREAQESPSRSRPPSFS